MTPRTFAAVPVALAAMQVALFGAILARTIVVLPYLDMLDWLAAYLDLHRGGGWAAYLLQFHNEHRPLWIRLLTIADVRLFAASGTAFVAGGTLALLALAAILTREFSRIPGAVRSGAVWLVPMLLLTAATAVDCSVPVNCVYPITALFAAAAVCLFDGAAEADAATPWRRAASVAAALGSGLADAVGLLTWPVLLWIAWRGGARRGWLGGIALLGAVYWAAYLRGVAPVLSTLPGAHSPMQIDLPRLVTVIHYAIVFMALPISRLPAGGAAGLVLGAVLLAAGTAAAIWLTMRPAPVGRASRIAGGLILFTLGSAAAAAAGRADFVAEVAVPVRYALFVAMLHVGLLALALPWLLTRANGPARAALLAVPVAVLLLAQQVVGGIAAAHVADAMSADLTRFYAGDRDPALAQRIYRDPDRPAQILGELREMGQYGR